MKQNELELKSILHYFKDLSLRGIKQNFLGRKEPDFKGFKPKFYKLLISVIQLSTKFE